MFIHLLPSSFQLSHTLLAVCGCGLFMNMKEDAQQASSPVFNNSNYIVGNSNNLVPLTDEVLD